MDDSVRPKSLSRGVWKRSRRGAIKEPNIHEFKGHEFVPTFYRLPAFCSFCFKLMCCAVHKKCHTRVLHDCSGTAKTSPETQALQQRLSLNVPHRFKEHTFLAPTFCDHCGCMIYGLSKQGLKCQSCDVRCHHKCKDLIGNLCGIDQKMFADILMSVQANKKYTLEVKPNEQLATETAMMLVPTQIGDSSDEDDFDDVTGRTIASVHIDSGYPFAKEQMNTAAGTSGIASRAAPGTAGKSPAADSTRSKFYVSSAELEDPLLPSAPRDVRPKSFGRFAVKKVDDPPASPAPIEKPQLKEEADNSACGPIKPISMRTRGFSLKKPTQYKISDFELLKVLGRGSYGQVFLAEYKNSDRYYAIKALRKDMILQGDNLHHAHTERNILSYLLFVLEYVKGGDLLFNLNHSGERMDLVRAKFYGAEIVCALQFLHSIGVIYRDIKSPNILLDSDGHVRLTDFGLAEEGITGDKEVIRLCGTLPYLAPEVVRKMGYNRAADWWSYGMLMFELIRGYLPHDLKDREKSINSILHVPITRFFPIFFDKHLRDFFTHLCNRIPGERLGMPHCPAGPIRSHLFFKGIDWDRLEKKECTPPFKPFAMAPWDAENFDKEFTSMRPELKPIREPLVHSIRQDLFRGTSFASESLEMGIL